MHSEIQIAPQHSCHSQFLPLCSRGIQRQAQSRTRHLELVLALLWLADRENSIIQAATHVKLSANRGIMSDKAFYDVRTYDVP